MGDSVGGGEYDSAGRAGPVMEQRLNRWEGATATALAAAWNVPVVHLYQRVGSTNDVARRLAEEGAPSGTIVLAEQQVAGRGRAGRAWASPPNLGVWLSVVLRAPAVADVTLLPLIIGLLAARALEPFAMPLRPQVKWPNDLLLDGRKLGGILCEAVWSAGSLAFILAGVGVNVHHDVADFPPELRGSATSLRIAGGAPARRTGLAGGIVRAILSAASPEGATMGNRLPTEMEAYDALRGNEVVVTGADAGSPIAGTAMGVSPDGALLLRSKEGVLRRVRSGSARLLSEAGSLPDSGRGTDDAALLGTPAPT